LKPPVCIPSGAALCKRFEKSLTLPLHRPRSPAVRERCPLACFVLRHQTVDIVIYDQSSTRMILTGRPGDPGVPMIVRVQSVEPRSRSSWEPAAPLAGSARRSGGHTNRSSEGAQRLKSQSQLHGGGGAELGQAVCMSIVKGSRCWELASKPWLKPGPCQSRRTASSSQPFPPTSVDGGRYPLQVRLEAVGTSKPGTSSHSSLGSNEDETATPGGMPMRTTPPGSPGGRGYF
jgi:hypothetical protein